jgi:hypothetical protein
MQVVFVGCRLRLREHASWDNSHVEGGDSLATVAVGNIAAEHSNRVLAEIETETERVLGGELRAERTRCP